MAITFDTFLNDLLRCQKRLVSFYSIDLTNTKIYFHLPTFYSVWAENNSGISRGDLVQDAKTRQYFENYNILKRIQGKPMRCCVLNYGNNPSSELLAFVYNHTGLQKKAQPSEKTCNCDISTLVARGCQCGGV